MLNCKCVWNGGVGEKGWLKSQSMKSSSQSCVAGRNHRREEKGACREPCRAQMKHRKQAQPNSVRPTRRDWRGTGNGERLGSEPSFQLRIFFLKDNFPYFYIFFI